MEKQMGLESLKRNTDFLRKNNIDFYILDYTLKGKLTGDGYINLWKIIKGMMPYNSFFLDISESRAAVILPEKSDEEAERLLKVTSEAAEEANDSVSIHGRVYSDINENLELEGVIYEEPVTTVDDYLEEESVIEEQGKKLNLSILDDDEVIRMFLSDQLDSVNWGEWDVNLEVYREGESFLNSGRLKAPGKHIIVLDGIMPRMDGMEVLSEIRKQYTEGEVSIIMLTSRNRENDIVSAFEAGAFDYVTKPFKINELIARIKRVAKRMEERDA
ncbi:response regulator transcription factor [Bacillus salacetis]|uniref:response regulator transcription factor n=1 Tax=Bacillus salacetis TaxID=2315464 RepID=UPI003BA014F2